MWLAPRVDYLDFWVEQGVGQADDRNEAPQGRSLKFLVKKQPARADHWLGPVTRD
jgi:hypothetical protein